MKSTNETEAVAKGDQKQKPTVQLDIKIASKWAAIVGVLAVGVLYMFLPERLTIGPSWLLLVIEVVALLPLVFSELTRRRFSHFTMRVYAMILLGIVTLALAVGIVLLVISLPTFKHATDLLGSAA